MLALSLSLALAATDAFLALALAGAAGILSILGIGRVRGVRRDLVAGDDLCYHVSQRCSAS